MNINLYKCDKCKAEFEGVGNTEKCPSCEDSSLKIVGQKEVNADASGCGGGCGHCNGC